MKVIVDCIGVRDGGAARLLILLFKHLCACRPDWTFVFCVLPEEEREFARPEIPNNAKYLEISMPFGWASRFHWLNKKLPALVTDFNADVLFSFANLPPARSIVPTVLFVQQMKILLPLSVVGLREKLRLWLLKRYLFAKASSACRIIVQSTQMKVLFSQYAPQLSGRVEVVQSSVESANLGPASLEITRVLNQALRPQIAYVSLPRTHKNHFNLLRAFSLVRKELPTAKLLLTIPGPDKDQSDSVVTGIHAEALLLGVSDAIVWLGNLPPADVMAVYDNVDVTVFPSMKESFGMPLAESLCALRPVIASDLPFAHEILGDAGAFFDPTNPDEIARVILETLQSPEKLEAMRLASGIRRGQFDPARMAERFCLLFEAVAKEKAGI